MPKLSENGWNRNKQKIIDTAFALFSEKGYARVSVNDIVKAAGISKGGFYTYFKNKQEIFMEILDRADTGKDAIMEETGGCNTFEEVLRAYIRYRLMQLMDDERKKWVKFTVEFWATVKRDARIAQKDDARFRQYMDDIRGIIEEGIAAGEFHCDPAAAAYVLIAMIDGMGLQSAVMDHAFDHKKIDVAIDMCMGYLKS